MTHPTPLAAAANPLTYEGSTVRRHGNFVDLRSMWHAVGRPANLPPSAWLSQPHTMRFIDHLRMAPPATPETMLRDIASLRRIRRIDPDFLFVTTSGHNRNLWAHWQIALAYAQDLDPAFHAWCNEVVRHRLPPQSGPEADLSRQLEQGLAGLHDRFDILDRHAADQLFLLCAAQHLVLGNRLSFTGRSQAIIRQIVANPPFAGRCPSCLTIPIVDASARPLPGAQFDHFFHRGLNRPEHGWLVCQHCHDAFSRGSYLTRFSKMAAFRQFQAALLAHRQAQYRPTDP
jgi:hypothetical protein